MMGGVLLSALVGCAVDVGPSELASDDGLGTSPTEGGEAEDTALKERLRAEGVRAQASRARYEEARDGLSDKHRQLRELVGDGPDAVQLFLQPDGEWHCVDLPNWQNEPDADGWVSSSASTQTQTDESWTFRSAHDCADFPFDEVRGLMDEILDETQRMVEENDWLDPTAEASP